MEITNPTTWPYLTCIETDVGLTAQVFPSWVSGGTYHWGQAEGGGSGSFNPNDSSSGSTTFHPTIAGSVLVNATYNLSGNAYTSDIKEITVITVDSLTPDSGTEIDDHDGDYDTKLYYAWAADSGEITITAVPNPAVAEDDLPACWSLTGGEGAGKLQRTVDKTATGEYVITCQSGTATKTVTIWIIALQVELPIAGVCDGAEPEVDIVVNPNTAPVGDILSHLNNLTLESETVGDTNNGNPAGTTDLAFDAIQIPGYTSKVLNAYWFSTQADDCNETSSYTIKAHGNDGGLVESQDDPELTVDAGGGCVNGSAGPTSFFAGNLQYATVENPPNSGNFETTVQMGAFHKDVHCTTTNVTLANSQFWQMVEDEENYHVGQMQGTNGNLCADLWDPALVLADVQNNQPYVAGTAADSLALAQAAFVQAQNDEIDRSNNIAFPYPGARRCAIEAEAKSAVGATFICTMPCSYPQCP